MAGADCLKKLTEDARILVTGGAGFIGSALVHALNRRGIENIVVVDILGSDGKWKNLSPLAFRDYWEAPEFAESIRTNLNRAGTFDFVFHLGACSATTERDASYLARNNFGWTKDICKWALGQEARFVYASSAATYGDGAAGMDDREQNLQRFRPLNPYGYSKQIFDLYAARNGWMDRIVGLKYFNVFGPNEYHKGEMRSLVCKAYTEILETGKMRLFKSYRDDYPDGGQKRDFLYVKDAVEMTLHLASTPSASGLFNLGSGVARTWLELAHALFAAVGKPPAIDFIEMPPALRDQYQYFTRADISKLQESGYSQAVTSLEDAVRDYVLHYLKPSAHLGDETA